MTVYLGESKTVLSQESNINIIPNKHLVCLPNLEGFEKFSDAQMYKQPCWPNLRTLLFICFTIQKFQGRTQPSNSYLCF